MTIQRIMLTYPSQGTLQYLEKVRPHTNERSLTRLVVTNKYIHVFWSDWPMFSYNNSLKCIIVITKQTCLIISIFINVHRHIFLLKLTWSERLS